MKDVRTGKMGGFPKKMKSLQSKYVPTIYEALGPAPPYIKQPKRGPSKKITGMDNFPTILVDTREQQPYLFKSYPCWIEKTGLKTGDYTIKGFESEVAVERKSKKDLYTSFSAGRRRVENEFQRLSEMKFTALVIEAPWEDIETPPERSRMNPDAIRNTIFSWSQKYNVTPILASDRREAERLTFEFLSWAEKDLRKKRKVRQ